MGCDMLVKRGPALVATTVREKYEANVDINQGILIEMLPVARPSGARAQTSQKHTDIHIHELRKMIK